MQLLEDDLRASKYLTQLTKWADIPDDYPDDSEDRIFLLP